MAKILVADDERGILDLYERALSKRGHDVETFGDGASAIEAIEGGEYDLVLTDLKMPHRSGLEVLAAARKRRATLPVILISGVTEAEERARAEALGVYMVLHKPVDLKYLLTIIESAVQSGEPRGPAAPAPAPAPAAQPDPPAPPLVRLVEREPCLANLLAYCLRKQGYRVTLEESRGAAAVVIVGAAESVGRVREDVPRGMVIALYPRGEGAHAVAALEAGADVALERPFEPEVLFAHVRAAVRRLEGAPAAAKRGDGADEKPITRNRMAAVRN